ncbi:TRAP transporter small permease [Fusobacterium necrophorum]|uniref:TRAP transporter small permease n=1 Tax=Fusobacterium necrophorum TaxID=859 RepID=A0A4Q2KYG9_9FUSO|nr:TRAP transporter small permease [Fusobacterium necrophorum]RXZ69023.1 TRAP transporter small permease [Fusobacterium necrophorum]
MEKLRTILDRTIEVLSIIIMSLMTILVSWQVITRYFFNKPSVVSEQLAQYLFVWLIMYVSAYVFGKRGHMQITFLRDLTKKKNIIAMDIIQEIIITIFVMSVMIYGGYFSSLRQMTQLDAALPISIGIIYSALPISGLFTIFYSISNIKRIVEKNRREKKWMYHFK